MWTILLFMALGVVTGVLVPFSEKQTALLGKLQTVGVVLLLFVMGLSMGLDRQLLSQLSTLGYKAAVYAGLTTLFSIACVYLFTRKLADKEGSR